MDLLLDKRIRKIREAVVDAMNTSGLMLIRRSDYDTHSTTRNQEVLAEVPIGTLNDELERYLRFHHADWEGKIG